MTKTLHIYFTITNVTTINDIDNVFRKLNIGVTSDIQIVNVELKRYSHAFLTLECESQEFINAITSENMKIYITHNRGYWLCRTNKNPKKRVIDASSADMHIVSKSTPINDDDFYVIN